MRQFLWLSALTLLVLSFGHYLLLVPFSCVLFPKFYYMSQFYKFIPNSSCVQNNGMHYTTSSLSLWDWVQRYSAFILIRLMLFYLLYMLLMLHILQVLNVHLVWCPNISVFFLDIISFPINSKCISFFVLILLKNKFVLNSKVYLSSGFMISVLR